MTTIIKPHSPQWHAWQDHYRQNGDTRRAKFMTWHADNTRWSPEDAGWTEVTEWPPREHSDQELEHEH
jgi:hypothetical protein